MKVEVGAFPWSAPASLDQNYGSSEPVTSLPSTIRATGMMDQRPVVVVVGRVESSDGRGGSLQVKKLSVKEEEEEARKKKR